MVARAHDPGVPATEETPRLAARLAMARDWGLHHGPGPLDDRVILRGFLTGAAGHVSTVRVPDFVAVVGAAAETVMRLLESVPIYT